MRHIIILLLLLISISCKSDHKKEKDSKQNESQEIIFSDRNRNVDVFNTYKDFNFKSKKARRLNNAGIGLIQNGKLKEAEKIFNKALEEEPNNPITLNNLGNISNLKNNTREAKGYFIQSFKASDSTYLDAYFNLGTTLYNNEEYTKSIEILRNIARHCNDRMTLAGTHYYLTLNLLKFKKCDAAQKEFLRTAELIKKNPDFRAKLEFLKNKLENCA